MGGEKEKNTSEMSTFEAIRVDMLAAAQLEAEISSLRTRLATLKRTLSLHTSTLLSSPALPSLINSPPAKSTLAPASDSLSEKTKSSLAHRISQQRTHNATSLYRACGGVTAFRVVDPDPRAVDDGSILGIRFEAPSGSHAGKFVRPYYVLLNRPWQGGSKGQDGQEWDCGSADYLKVHKHTVPECIPLSALAARWLPAPPQQKAARRDGADADSRENDVAQRCTGRKRQNLPRFVRALRREILRYHNRASAIADLRRVCRLDPSSSAQTPPDKPPISSSPSPSPLREDEREEKEEENTLLDPDPLAQNTNMSNPQKKPPRSDGKIIDVAPVDAAAKQIRLEWADGRTGRLVLDDDGNVVKMAVFSDGSRDRETVREIMPLHLQVQRTDEGGRGGRGGGGCARIEDIVDALGAKLDPL